MSKAKKKGASQPEAPDITNPWADSGDEIIEPGIGIGFVDWDALGENLRGVLGRRWRSKAMRSPAITIELTEAPNVGIFNTQGSSIPVAVDADVGDKVNMSLTHDLERKLTDDLEGEEVGIQYVSDLPTRSGSMRVFRVVRFSRRSER